MNELAINNIDLIVEELNSIIVEKSYQGHLLFIEMWHEVGSTILEYGLTEHLREISQKLGVNIRTIQKSVQFAKKYPDLSTLYDSEGKNITWYKVSNMLLPAKQEENVEVNLEGLKHIFIEHFDELLNKAETNNRYVVIKIPLKYLNY